jgi:hypothetical protein
MLMKINISLIPMNQAVARRFNGVGPCLFSLVQQIYDKKLKHNIINFSKKSALTVSQQIRINQQLEIGGIGYALARLRQ